MNELHPIVAPAVTATERLGAWNPANAEEYARIMDGLRALTSQLALALHSLGGTAYGLDGLTPDQSRLIAGHLDDAASRLGFVTESLDWAREATGVEWAR
jgi:hypothetical protein